MIDFQVGDLFYSSLGLGYLSAIDEKISIAYPYVIHFFNKDLKISYDRQELESFTRLGIFKHWRILK